MTRLANPITIAAVIPTFQRLDKLPEAISSALEQSLPPHEVIVADNDPAESAAELVSALGGKVRYVAAHSVSGGHHARNAGAWASSSDWLAFLDDDDLWLPGYFETAAKRAQETDAELILTPITRRLGDQAMPGKTPTEDITVDRLLADGNPGIVGSNIFISRDAFERLGGFDESMPAAEDIDLLARALETGVRIAATSTPLVILRLHVGARRSNPKIQARARAHQEGRRILLAKHGAFISAGTKRKIIGRYHASGYLATQNPALKSWHLIRALLNGNRRPISVLLGRR